MSTEPDIHIERITPTKAREYLKSNTRNRNLRSRVVNAYAADIAAGDWDWNGDGIKFAADGTLLDGQHRLAAIAKADTSVRMMVVRGLPLSTQETMDVGAKRTFSDLLRLRGEAHYVPLATTVRAVAAWEAGERALAGKSRAFTNRQLLHTLDTYPWIREGMSLVQRAARGAELPVSVTGVLWWVFAQIDSDDAEDFFSRLASDENHSAGQPIYTLRRLLAASQEGVRGERNGRYLTAVTIKAWNKYRLGESCDLLKFRVGGANPEKFPEPR